MIFVAETSNGGKITYRDTKRYLWVFSVLSPTVPGICAAILLMGGGAFWSFAPLIFYYGVIPILDMIVGEDTNNPPEEVVERMAEDNFYRVLLFLTIPVSYLAL